MARTLNGNLTGAAARTQHAQDFEERLDEANPNSSHWQYRMTRAFDELQRYPLLRDIWNSGLVPERATYKKHALIAEMLLRHKDVMPLSEPILAQEGENAKRNIRTYVQKLVVDTQL